MSAPESSRPLAVVTGPTAGIGREFAERLAARGHDLLLVSRDAARLRQVADSLAARHGITADLAAHDLTDPAQVEALAAALAARPRVDVLVNNAGFGTLGALARTAPAAQAAMIQLHCATPLRLTQAVLPGMIARRAGLVINVCSVAAFVTGPGNATYSGTKAFLRLATDGLSAELVGTGVRVQALCPGFTRTEFHDRMGFAPTNIPRPLWLTPAAVVAASLRAADQGGPVTVVPGLRYKALIAVVRLLPLRLFSFVIRRAPRTRGEGPDATKSDTAGSDTTKSDTTKSDTTKSDTTRSDTTKSDTTKSDTTKSDTARTGTATSETARRRTPTST